MKRGWGIRPKNKKPSLNQRRVYLEVVCRVRTILHAYVRFCSGQVTHPRYKKANIPPVVSTKSPANNNLLYISETTLRGGFFVLYQVVRIDLPRFPEYLIGNKWEPITHLTEQGFLSKFSPNL